MTFQQVTPPDTSARDGLGWCLRHTQSVFGAPADFESAREAWDGQQGRHPGELPPPGVAVPIFFDHYGSYGDPARWGNWGHAATMLADGRVLSSPLVWWDTGPDGKGSAIYPDIASLQAAIGGSPNYLGWSEYMNGKQIVTAAAPTPPPPPPVRKRPMLLAHYKHAAGENQERWAFFAPGFWLELETKAATVQFKAQLDMKANSFECGSAEPWEKFKTAATAGVPLDQLEAMVKRVLAPTEPDPQ